MHPDSPFPRALVERMRRAPRIVVLTGAGVSAESGVPTFRDAMTGLWAQFDPRELATPAAFARNPKRVWDWYAARREAVAAVAPNPGHLALAAIERRVDDFLLVTQNVDGLHGRAGSRKVVELHGNLARVRCSRDGRIAGHWSQTSAAEPPRCNTCGAFLRPDVVWFEEMLPEAPLAAAQHAARHCDMLLVVGTSGEVYPAAALPRVAKERGARVVEINPVCTPLSALADDVIRLPAGVALPALLRAVWPDAAATGPTPGGAG